MTISKKTVLLFLLIITLVLGIQLAAVNRPFGGHFASYQTALASITDNILRENFSELLLPKTNLIILGSERSLHLNQYPFPSVLAAAGIKLFNGSVELWGRLQAILFNLATALLVGLIGKRLFSTNTGITAAVLFLLSPYTLIYGQSFMSEPAGLFFLVFSFFLLPCLRGKNTGAQFVILSAVFFSLAVAGRLHFILFLPAYLFSFFLFDGRHKWTKSIVYVVIALALPVAWYFHTYFAGREAVNLHTNLFVQLSGAAKSENSLLLNLDYYKRIVGIFAGWMLTPLLLPFFILGFLFPKGEGKSMALVVGGLVCGAATLVLASQKVMHHDFYLYGLFPFVVLLTARGFSIFLERFPFLKKIPAILIMILIYAAMSGLLCFSPIFTTSSKEKKAVEIGRYIENQTAPTDKIIVVGRSSPMLIYYIKRPVWSMALGSGEEKLPVYLRQRPKEVLGEQEALNLQEASKDDVRWLEHLKGNGAAYVVSMEKEHVEQHPEFLDYLMNSYHQISGPDDDYYFFKLKKR